MQASLVDYLDAAIDVMDEGTRADQLLKRPRAAQEATTTLGSPPSSSSAVLSNGSPANVHSISQLSRALTSSTSSQPASTVESLLAASVGAAVNAAVSAVSAIKSPSDKRRKRTLMCFEFKKGGECSRGDDCRFSHDAVIEDLAQQQSTSSRNCRKSRCFAFRDGNCRRGDQCMFKHD